jgi:hypothetical protein
MIIVYRKITPSQDDDEDSGSGSVNQESWLDPSVAS